MLQAHCIHEHEAAVGYAHPWAVNWHLTTTATGVPSLQRGGFQINVDTWASYAPASWPRDPARASRAQQVVVAHRIWWANGARWGGNQWPGTAAACGIR